MTCDSFGNPLTGYTADSPDLGYAFTAPCDEQNLVQGVVFGHYGGNAPPWTPAAGVGVAFDIDAPRQWFYANGAWN